MSKIVRVHNGDYKIIVGSDSTYGNILLDTNPTGALGAQGQVRITGDLLVEGNTTTIESETLTVKDNIIYLNVGETGAGVATLGTSAGLQIDRGSLPDVSILFDETKSSFNPVVGSTQPGTFVFRDASLNLKSISTNSINTDGGDLALINSGTGVITVTGTTNYENQVLDSSLLGVSLIISAAGRSSNVAEIVTTTSHGLTSGDKVTVTCFLEPSFNTTSPIVVNVLSPTRFEYNNSGSNIVLASTTGTVVPYPVIDDDYIPNMKALADFTASALLTSGTSLIRENDTKVQTYDFDTSGVSEITFEVDGLEQAVINGYGLTVGNIRVSGNSIENISNDNILLDNVLNIANKTSVPSTPTGYVKLYSTNIPGNGGTGLYFVNTTGTNDELVSKTRALLYSLIL